MTLNLPFLYFVWTEEYHQTSPNKNKSPNLWHVTSILVCCIFACYYLGCKLASLKSSSYVWGNKEIIFKDLLFRKDWNQLCNGVPLPTKSKRAPFEMGPYCHMRQKDLSLDLGVWSESALWVRFYWEFPVWATLY